MYRCSIPLLHCLSLLIGRRYESVSHEIVKDQIQNVRKSRKGWPIFIGTSVGNRHKNNFLSQMDFPIHQLVRTYMALHLQIYSDPQLVFMGRKPGYARWTGGQKIIFDEETSNYRYAILFNGAR